MLNDTLFMQQSLTNNLFYLRMLRDFSLNIELSFFENNQELINAARDFGKRAEELLEKNITLANNKLFKDILDSQIFISDYTLDSELLTEKLFDIDINTNLTEQVTNLTGNNQYVANEQDIEKVQPLNTSALDLVSEFIDFLEYILNTMKKNNLFSYSYPTFYEYILLDMNLFKSELERLIEKNGVGPTYILSLQVGKLDSMKKQTQFIQGLSDPNQTGIITQARNFEEEFNDLLAQYKVSNLSPDAQKVLNEKALDVTERFQSFLSTIIERLLAEELYFITPPIFLNNLLMDINYFIYLLKGSGLGILK